MREKKMSSIDTVIGGKKTFTVNGDTDHHHYCKPLLVKQNTFEECANSSITTFNSSDSMAKVEARDSSTTEILEDQVDRREYKLQIVWTNVILQVLLHSSFLWEYLYLRKYPDRWETHWTLIKFNVVYALFTGLGITAGAHRLWSHRSYKAKAPLRLFLALGFASAGQNDIYEWARDHRVHHKFSETDADPHNASRGFFFSHMGWLMCKKHPDVSQKGRSVDMSDLLQDPIVVWQRKYYKWLVLILNVLFPTLFPMYYWNIPFWQCIYMSFARYAMSLHLTWLVNSAAHIHGSRPYDARIGPREQNFWKIPNFLGEMYHNYHHVFPQDYKASEYGWLGQWNLAALFIDLMAWMGQAYDLREAPKSVVTQRKERTGEYSKMYRKIERKDSDLH